MLPSGMDPKPVAVLPDRISTVTFAFSTVTLSRATPPNLIGVR